LDYFNAVQVGRSRVQEATRKLSEVTGPAYPMLFLKVGKSDWTPVGEEFLCSLVMGKEKTAAVVICDNDGNAKTMSRWFPLGEAETYLRQLTAGGMPQFSGEVNLPI
jgi:hypothetical protein